MLWRVCGRRGLLEMKCVSSSAAGSASTLFCSKRGCAVSECDWVNGVCQGSEGSIWRRATDLSGLGKWYVTAQLLTQNEPLA